MRVSVEITSSLGRRMTVVVPAAQIENQVQARLEKLSHTANLPGYRRGKVPQKVVAQQYGAAARSEALDEILQSSLGDALVQEKLQPAGMPVVQSFKADPGHPLEYSVTFEITPEVHVKDISDVAIEKLVAPIEESDVIRVLEQIRGQHVEWEEVQRPATMGDKITADIQRLVDGQPDANVQERNTFFIMDEKTLQAGFSALLNTKAGDRIVVDLPSQQLDQNNEAKTFQVAVKVIAVFAPKLPALSDDFATKLGVTGGLEALRQEIQKQMQHELERVLNSKLKEQIINVLIERHTFELPKSMIDAEYQRLEQELIANIEKQTKQKIKPDQIAEADRNYLSNMAQRRVTLGLLFSALVKQHNISIDKARVQAQIAHIVGSFENPEEIAKMVYSNKNMMSNIHSQVLEEQIVEQLLKQIQYKEKNVSYAEVMELNKPTTHEQVHVHDEHCNHDHV